MDFPQRTFAGLVLGLALSAAAGASGLQERIDAAAPGATLKVGPGHYAGPLVIDKPLTLAGHGWPRIDGGGKGSVISIRADDVCLRGLVIANSGTDLTRDDAAIHVTADRAVISGNRIADALHGIYLKKSTGSRVLRNEIRGKTTLPAPARPASETIVTDSPDLCSPLNVNVRGNGIHLWNSRGCELDGNTITDTRDGMYFSFTDHTTVRANRIHGVRYGLHYMYSDDNAFDGNSFADNAAGAAIMFSKNLVVRGNRFEANHGFRAYGLLLSSVDATRIEGNRLCRNTIGIYLENNNNNVISGNTIEGNYVGVRLTASSGDNVFTRNTFAGNMHSAELAGQNETNRWSLDGIGNHWQGAAPIDLDGDGTGELPHREVDLLGGLRREAPAVGLLSGSPGLGLLEFAHRHVALPKVHGITDPAPLTTRP
ncbi:nitrous oxide reductase family maturation protein NosD [Haloferula sargassicola]|uniref:ABC transporter binding protein NosD n=1 Tax=Haloferula sargassicola TaxID=490096 RepID=A0ABP9UME1_9BACT